MKKKNTVSGKRTEKNSTKAEKPKSTVDMISEYKRFIEMHYGPSIAKLASNYMGCIAFESVGSGSISSLEKSDGAGAVLSVCEDQIPALITHCLYIGANHPEVLDELPRLNRAKLNAHMKQAAVAPAEDTSIH